eukprot:gnl/Trimastix_PCT/40.p1 GENE.gnl/Trimastix_PCT/40~~gnl/Trimastix_PCT/40.p1  ORF type:complete len:749 (+),score=165.39 gnl/Trimastix_PCT/40:290-2248(+)
MEANDTDLSEVVRVPLEELNTAVQEATSVTAAAWMLSVLADTAVAHGHMATHLTGLLLAGHHLSYAHSFKLVRSSSMRACVLSLLLLFGLVSASSWSLQFIDMQTNETSTRPILLPNRSYRVIVGVGSDNLIFNPFLSKTYVLLGESPCFSRIDSWVTCTSSDSFSTVKTHGDHWYTTIRTLSSGSFRLHIASRGLVVPSARQIDDRTVPIFVTPFRNFTSGALDAGSGAVHSTDTLALGSLGMPGCCSLPVGARLHYVPLVSSEWLAVLAPPSSVLLWSATEFREWDVLALGALDTLPAVCSASAGHGVYEALSLRGRVVLATHAGILEGSVDTITDTSAPVAFTTGLIRWRVVLRQCARRLHTPGQHHATDTDFNERVVALTDDLRVFLAPALNASHTLRSEERFRRFGELLDGSQRTIGQALGKSLHWPSRGNAGTVRNASLVAAASSAADPARIRLLVAGGLGTEAAGGWGISSSSAELYSLHTYTIRYFDTNNSLITCTFVADTPDYVSAHSGVWSTDWVFAPWFRVSTLSAAHRLDSVDPSNTTAVRALLATVPSSAALTADTDLRVVNLTDIEYSVAHTQALVAYGSVLLSSNDGQSFYMLRLIAEESDDARIALARDSIMRFASDRQGRFAAMTKSGAALYGNG